MEEAGKNYVNKKISNKFYFCELIFDGENVIDVIRDNCLCDMEIV